jgi:hypothetical protein
MSMEKATLALAQQLPCLVEQEGNPSVEGPVHDKPLNEILGDSDDACCVLSRKAALSKGLDLSEFRLDEKPPKEVEMGRHRQLSSLLSNGNLGPKDDIVRLSHRYRSFQ